MKKKRTLRRSRRPSPCIALLTDFGLEDHFVGTMKGIILSINPKVRVVDISHGVSPQRVQEAAFLLWSSFRYFPKGTIFLCVVDPGVGTSRRLIAVRTPEYSFLGPENGLLDFILADQKILEAVVIDVQKAKRLILSSLSSTFHGRDILAPLAAHLSLGKDLIRMGRRTDVGEPKLPLVRSKDDPVKSGILHIDHFGNIVTNILLENTPKGIQKISMVAAGSAMVSHWVENYQSAPEKTPCLVVGSSGLVEIVVKNDNAARLLNVTIGTPLRIYWQ